MLIEERSLHLSPYFVPGASLILLHLMVVINLRGISIIPFCRWGAEHQKDQITQFVNCGPGIQTCAFLILIPIMLPFDELYVHVQFHVASLLMRHDYAEQKDN